MSQRKYMLASIFWIIFVFCQGLASQGWPKYDQRGNLTENYSSQGLNFFLSSSKSRYFMDEAIIIECHIKNEGLYPVTIYLNNNILKNFTFVVRDQNGQSLPLKTSIIGNSARKKNQDFYGAYTATEFDARAIVLQPGEIISRTFNLLDLITPANLLPGTNNFSVMAYFYPNPEQSGQYYISSANEYAVFIDMMNNFQSNTFYAENALPFQELKVNPKEVIYLMLTAEYEKNWLDYFKYIDLHEVIRDYPDHARQYIRAPENKKGLVIEEFKRFLMSNSRQKLIKFEVVSQNLENSKATVKVRAMREIDGFDRDFLYTYYLSAINNLWQVSGIESQLIK